MATAATTERAPPNDDDSSHQEEDAPTGNNNNHKTALERAMECKDEGNAAFVQKNYRHALQAYERGLQVLDDDTNDNSNNTNELRVNLWSNRAMAQLRLGECAAAVASCTYILETLRVPLPKAFHRRAMARHDMVVQQQQTALSSSSSPPAALAHTQQMALLQAAKADLQSAVHYLDQSGGGTMSADEQTKQKLNVAQFAQRLQQRILMVAQQQRKHEQAGNVGAAPTEESSSSSSSSSLATAAAAALPTTAVGAAAAMSPSPSSALLAVLSAIVVVC